MGDFSKFDQRARAGEHLNVVFLGGSLTWGACSSDPQLYSYRALVSQRLEEHYPDAHFKFWDAAIGGTSSNLAAYRLQRDVISHHPDLVFIDFTVNDNPYSVDDDKLASYESLTRRVLLETGAPVELIILAVKPDLEPAKRQPRPRDAKHKEVAVAYNTALADVVAYMNGEVQKGRYTPDQMWNPETGDTHPNNTGYLLYSEAVWQTFLDAVAQKKVCRVPDKMLFGDTYMTWKRQRLSQLTPLPAGWTVGRPLTGGTAFDFYMSRWLEDVTIASPGAAPFRFKIQAKSVLLFGETTPQTGTFLVTIDGKPAISPDSKDGIYGFSLADQPGGNMHLVRVLATNLDPTVPHILEIDPQLQHVVPPPPGIGKQQKPFDQALCIESLCVAGGPATVEVAP